MSKAIQQHLEYFGKLPSRGDFVRSARNPQLLNTLDQWLSRTMEMMAEDPRWKLVYDTIAPLHFAFLGSHSKIAVAGHLAASGDASQRRFPFIVAAAFEVQHPMHFQTRSPLALARLWARAEAHMTPLLGPQDPAGALQNLADTLVTVDVTGPGSPHDGTFDDFLDHQTLEGLTTMLKAASGGAAVNPRRTLLALGILLKPLIGNTTPRVEKGLSLPLPTDPLYRSLVAVLWLELCAPFVSRADFEVAIVMTRIQGRDRLIIGLDGGSARTLHSVFDPQAYMTQNIDIDDPEWVDDQARADSSLTKLVSYLDQPQLSLRVAVDTFREVFTGE
ncbi:type VI secretion system protein ImpM [Robbsia andropogonis]|uniref:type VI secretion system-associated protein TagF n=1 Tax=Robbsia andropogonis TaxID=28092 RepID=UPI00209D5787|nr:type VI secretion system-associated protein TagF [Robbsia andropogonis]MCP1117288.1 type VI secretion system-associated protein TagF [Robbsia andropogonis]MCP1129317.1 type VI secretion system-associated protein TagF [Robbsia andropogonis]